MKVDGWVRSTGSCDAGSEMHMVSCMEEILDELSSELWLLCFKVYMGRDGNGEEDTGSVISLIPSHSLLPPRSVSQHSRLRFLFPFFLFSLSFSLSLSLSLLPRSPPLPSLLLSSSFPQPHLYSSPPTNQKKTPNHKESQKKIPTK